MADSITDELAQELLAVHEDSYGKSAKSVRVHLPQVIEVLREVRGTLAH